MEGIARRGPDAPVAERLRQIRSPLQRRTVRSYVEGFSAADPSDASALAVRDSVPDGSERRLFRLVSGYRPLIDHLAESVDVATGRDVRAIRHDARGVTVTTRTRRGLEEWKARTAVVTVPIGVLRAGHIALDPDVPGMQRAVSRLAMGAVVRLVLQLDAPLGELLGRPDASFLETPGASFATWWSSHPVVSPLAVAWVGGPRARHLHHEPAARLVERARRDLRSTLGISRPRIHRAWRHDWVSDPFSRGAYAYPLVGGAGAGTALARPMGALLFAGEATSAAHAGTVEGAIESGERAAKQALRRA